MSAMEFLAVGRRFISSLAPSPSSLSSLRIASARLWVIPSLLLATSWGTRSI